LPGDITLSSAALAVVTAVIAALVSAIGILYYSGRSREKELTAALMEAKDAEIARGAETTARLMVMLDRLIPAVEETSRQVQRLVTLIETWRSGRPA